ncbi:heterokaryon incompatibility protein-domain-containing protein [Cadophora sp. MPI-SDFR-AT-0126]|nr:heterokaryon incompatibility protein-domain-containing protein [Leotiomycetes sp. MPI-SDFR-AT-0126]
MGPLNILVPELDARIRDMDDSAQALRKAITISAPPQDRDTKQEAFNASISVVIWHCLKPSFAALVVFFLDFIIGSPLSWKSLSVLPILLLSFAAVSKQRPAAAVVILVILSTLPWISRSFTRLLGSYLCFDTFFSPLIWYTYEDISDHTEIRWVMIGIVLDVVYLCTVALIFLLRPLFSMPLVVFSWIGFLIVGMITFDPGWTMSMARSAPEMQVPGKPLETIPRYMLQRVMFRLNRYVRHWGQKLGIVTRKDAIMVSRQRLPYQYTPLYNESPRHRRNFRLLKVLKGASTEEVKCRTIIVSLDNPPTYEAISYVWGDPSKEKSIVVDHLDLEVTRSAYDIIHRRRSPWQDRMIWIDQVCINQEAGDGNREKQYQVQMMREIYQGAARVLAFLRQDHPVVEFDKPTPQPDAYLVQSHFAELFYRHDILGHDPATFKAVYQGESKAAQWDALVAFFANPWFRRVWIIQEAVFARDLIVFYGDICLDWRYLAQAVNVIYDQNLLQRFQSSDPYVQSTLREEYNMGLHNVDSMLEFRGDVKYELAFTLEHALSMCMHAGSTDPRDKIYALLGMTTDQSRDLICPEYGSEVTARMVYTRAMRLILSRRMAGQDENVFNPLTIAGIGFNRNIQDLPSWVPDWSQTKTAPIADIDYRAGSQYPPSIHFPQDDQFMIYLRGFSFDKVKVMSEPLLLEPELRLEIVDVYTRDWFHRVEALAKSLVQDPYPFTNEPFLEAFVRTVLGNRSSYGANSQPSTEQCLLDYAAFYELKNMKEEILAQAERGDTDEISQEFSRKLLEVTERASRFNSFTGHCLLRKRFCVSAGGRMGSVPPHCKEGDIICIINGARTPFLLREETGGKFRLVGCCYFHGSMLGEAPAGEMQTFQIV